MGDYRIRIVKVGKDGVPVQGRVCCRCCSSGGSQEVGCLTVYIDENGKKRVYGCEWWGRRNIESGKENDDV